MIVINDSGGTVKNFSIAISLCVQLNCIPLCYGIDGLGTVVMLVACLVVFTVASTMFLHVCKKDQSVSSFFYVFLFFSFSSRCDLAEKISFYLLSFFWNCKGKSDIVCMITQHTFCASSVGWFFFYYDRRFSVAGSFSIVSRTSVICAIT